MMGERVVGEFEAAINGQHCAIYGETLDYDLRDITLSKKSDLY